ncbi:MAG TPA: hypothetical protein VGM12_07485 [Trebonia sp.]
MPPHGYERPTRSGSPPPRPGFAMRPPAPGDPVDADQDIWEPSRPPDGREPNGREPSPREPSPREPSGREPNGREPNARDSRRPPGSGAYGRPVPEPSDVRGGAGPGRARGDFDPRREPRPYAADGPRPSFRPGPEPAGGGLRRRPGGGFGTDLSGDGQHPQQRPADPAPDRAGGQRLIKEVPYSERIEQLLVAAQRQIAEHAAAVAADAEVEAGKIRAAAESYASGLRSSAEFERASARSESEREAAKARAAAERERDDIVRAARREADDIRRREQFLLEQSEALRSQAEADLDVELADRRADAERLEGERLAEAQEATRKLVEEAERRAADAEKRAADATARAEQARRDAEADAKKEIADAHRKAELVIAQAKDEGKQITADLEADTDKRRAALQKELDELTRQKNEVDEKLAQMRQLFAVSAFLDTPAS